MNYKRYLLQDVYDGEKQEKFNVVSTFAGGGGSSTVYRLAGGKILLINEFVEEARKTYRENYPNTKILPDDIKNLIGLFIIIALVLQNLKSIRKITISSNWYYLIGFLTGIFNILVGVIAPLLAVIIKHSLNEKKSIVGTLGYFGFVGNFTKIVGFSLIGFTFIEYIDTFLLMIPATLLGSRIGQFLLDKISNKFFFYIFQVILIALALRLLLT